MKFTSQRGLTSRTPHDRDECHLILSSEGKFLQEGEVTTFKDGDFLCIPAFVSHRVIEFTEDFVAWVFFADQALSGKPSDFFLGQKHNFFKYAELVELFGIRVSHESVDDFLPVSVQKCQAVDC